MGEINCNAQDYRIVTWAVFTRDDGIPEDTILGLFERNGEHFLYLHDRAKRDGRKINPDAWSIPADASINASARAIVNLSGDPAEQQVELARFCAHIKQLYKPNGDTGGFEALILDQMRKKTKEFTENILM